ncbi:SRPBCC family protein [Flavobacterium rhizosphaerae]|uniref:SRPBCC domain-containing protein n=1 Tax=Flavobacterium rhizosphaerae TaxID=3163298 RepID=A0ABW8YWV3_9FLAO
MTPTKTIKTEIKINAPRERVWEVLIKDEYTQQWYTEFCEGSKAETTWEEGSAAIFTDSNGNGMVTTIAVNRPTEELIIQYEGLMINGKPDYDSPQAKEVKKGYESYLLDEKNGITTLRTAAAMSEEFFEMTGDAWERAKDKIKQLAEQK